MYNVKIRGERGMASIVITMVTMVVISLIILGFAVISRREQRQSLDRLQSSQAFYAAESGIEDAKSVIKAAVNSGQPVIGKDNCTSNNPGGGYPTGNQMIVDDTYKVSYTCLKVDSTPDNLRFDGIGDNGIVVPVTSAQPITSVRVSWTPTTPPSGTPVVCPNTTDHSFGPQTAAGWPCDYGVLRADVVPTDGGLTRAGLTASTLTSFFEPTRNNATGILDYGTGRGHANIVAANCTTASYTKCTATVSGITGGTTSLMLRLSSMYRTSNITVESLNGTNVQGISGVQAIIDSTGKATDVLRRIQIRLPIIQTGGLLPSFAVQSSASLCKRFTTTVGYFNIPGDIAQPDATNDMCKQITDGAPSADPAAPPAVLGGAANALLQQGGICPPSGCVNPASVYKYSVHYTNRSNNLPSSIRGCHWAFTDGTSADDVSCNEGEGLTHVYPKLNPELPFPISCYSKPETATITIFLNNGTTATDSRSDSIPFCT